MLQVFPDFSINKAVFIVQIVEPVTAVALGFIGPMWVKPNVGSIGLKALLGLNGQFCTVQVSGRQRWPGRICFQQGGRW